MLVVPKLPIGSKVVLDNTSFGGKSLFGASNELTYYSMVLLFSPVAKLNHPLCSRLMRYPWLVWATNSSLSAYDIRFHARSTTRILSRQGINISHAFSLAVI